MQTSVTEAADLDSNSSYNSGTATVEAVEEHVSSSSSSVTGDVALTCLPGYTGGSTVPRTQRQQLACQHELLLESLTPSDMLQQSPQHHHQLHVESCWSDFTTIESRRAPATGHSHQLASSTSISNQTADNLNEADSSTRQSTSTLSSNDNKVNNHGVEKKDSEMESGIESDQDDDRTSVGNVTRAAAAAAGAGQGITEPNTSSSSIDELIASLMVPPPPPAAGTSPCLDVTQLLRAPPPPPTPPADRFQRRSDDIYSDLVTPPPPPSLASPADDADVEAFLAKIVACNGVVTPQSAHDSSVNRLSMAASRYFGSQMSEPGCSAQLAQRRRSIDKCATVSHASSLPHSVDNGQGRVHQRCVSMMDRVDSASSSTNGHSSGRSAYVASGSDGVLGDDNGYCSVQSGNVAEDPACPQDAVNDHSSAPRTGSRSEIDWTRRCDSLPPVSDSSTLRAATLQSRRANGDDVGGTLTRRSIRRRRLPPPPPPRTSSVQSSPALSCRSEQLTRRVLPRTDRLTSLPSPTPAPRAALIRPAALRSSFTATKDLYAAAAAPPSPDTWRFRRSHSLTDSTTAGRSTQAGGRSSLLAAIGSRLKSYWLPRQSGDRPSTAAAGEREPSSADYRRPSLEMPSRPGDLTDPGDVDLGLLFTDDDDTDDTYLSFDVTRQLRPSSTMSSFSSFTGD